MIEKKKDTCLCENFSTQRFFLLCALSLTWSKTGCQNPPVSASEKSECPSHSSPWMAPWGGAVREKALMRHKRGFVPHPRHFHPCLSFPTVNEEAQVLSTFLLTQMFYESTLMVAGNRRNQEPKILPLWGNLFIHSFTYPMTLIKFLRLPKGGSG